VQKKGKIKAFEMLVARLKMSLEWEPDIGPANAQKTIPASGGKADLRPKEMSFQVKFALLTNYSTCQTSTNLDRGATHLGSTRVTQDMTATLIEPSNSGRLPAENMQKGSMLPNPNAQKILTVVLHHSEVWMRPVSLGEK
ncbi:hypothetical protein FRC10_004834, partial [Ceratobasidium sp. 414]